ncbi:MFS transporter [Bacillus atrophaeus]|uniref:Inositol transport protein n=1 Tax=Bacillus atrophaeus (strain 1942) TaxID=720555 RepID=A0ABM5M2S8_BACA1|nr:MFS transporter [Bacillus atrophaeus]AMR64616.1 MFS transporter [Bacillus subtilis subsp. globigii]ADP34490.1 inositol transport protein [Bacillus atrophaeus 1942]AIK46733.1 sugar (and other) transporter family protein [Bacillus atrophaeus subsp. globigii]EIM11468.1 inositol transport protein [Bacillus atrophaeus C89]KFK82808.1 sugar (and other) transporter family protein [Bacillus atrophaeus]
MNSAKADSAFNKRTIAAALANYIDAGSIVAGSAGLSMWVSYLKLSDSQIGLLGAFSANAISAAVGALLGGYLADKVGRKAVYTNSMLVYALGICLVLFGMNFPMLLSGYMIIGISVGADITASWTIIAENAPKRNRARHCGVAQVAWAAGAVVVLMLSVLVGDLGLLGNKIVFAHLLVIALITYILRIRLPESEAWKDQSKQPQAEGAVLVNKTSYLNLLKPTFLKKIMFLMGVYLIWNLAAGVMGFFMPYIYQQVGGVSANMANLLQMGLFIFTGLGVAFIFMPFADKYRKTVFGICAFMAVIGWSLFLMPVQGMPILLLFIVAMGINNGAGQQANYQLWASELFPTEYRASAQGLMFFLVRISIGVWSLFVPMIMTNFGIGFMAAILLGCVTASMIIGLVFAPNTSGKSLEEIQEDLYGTPAAKQGNDRKIM